MYKKDLEDLLYRIFDRAYHYEDSIEAATDVEHLFNVVCGEVNEVDCDYMTVSLARTIATALY